MRLKTFLMTLALLSLVLGQAWAETYKIGYIEGGEWYSFTNTYNETLKELKKQGWIEKLEFPQDARYSPGWDFPEKLEAAAKEITMRDDLSLIIAAGTDATKAVLKFDQKKTPIVSIAVADALKSGFVLNENDSGMDHYTARLVPNRYKRMFDIFHEVVRFKKLGIMYADIESNKIFGNVYDAREVASSRGFQLEEYSKLPAEASYQTCENGLKELIGKGIDAFFMGPLDCFDWKKADVAALLKLLTENKVAVFARDGTDYVKGGALIGFSTYDFSGRGRWFADKVIKILNGTKPRALPMVDNATPKISFNVYVSGLIGFDPPVDILLASDEIWQEITLPENRLIQ